ncbi:TonB-dependent siderophore receptor [Methylomonas koyamae]|uniref:Secretin/TonB short N-terminal domain-containing protein n=1 Tax=Methylomonas koyamae TaxID=702114 RepID=A0AA91DH22_9GAMM|nr:TonB-dependent receptor [Methylomonas koyamae]OAI30292.1 hypothetical protein A1356_21675 [Methylomonas koyamae]
MRQRFTFRAAPFAMAFLALAGRPLQAAETGVGATKAYTIPAGNLSQALTRFADQADIKLIFNPELTRNLNAPQLQGQLTVEQGLHELLQGSGLMFRVSDRNTIVIEKKPVSSGAQPQSTTTLPSVTVTGARFSPDDDPVSYSARNATTATKTSTAIVDTPFSIQVLSPQVMRDTQAVRLADALENVSGVRRSFNSGGVYDNFLIRGFQVQDTFRDGFRTDYIDVDLANVERIEVLKGAAAGLYGRIEPGGAINYEIKKPLAEAQYSVQQQFGSYDFFRTVADATGPLNQDKSVRYRAILTYQGANSFRDEIEDNRISFTPSLAWDITAQTRAYLNYEYKNHEYHYDTGIPNVGDRPANVPFNRRYGILDAPLASSENHLVNFTLSHDFNQDWTLKFLGNFRSQNRDFPMESYMNGLRGDNRTMNMDVYRARVEEDHWMGEVNLTGHFRTGPVAHSALLAGEYYYDQWNWIEGYIDSVADVSVTPRPLDLYNPQYQHSSEMPDIHLQWAYGGRSEWYGFTFQDEAQLTERWRLLFTGRYQEMRSSSSDYCDALTGPCGFDNPGFHPQTDSAFTPRVGTSYKLMPWLSLFASYSESMSSAQGRQTLSGAAAGPTLGDQKEIGLKGSWLEDRINATLAFYDLNKTNIAIAIPGFGNFVELTGEARSRGVEVDVTGKVTDNLSLIASYAYTDSMITKDPDFVGNRMPNVPRNAGSLWAKYEFDNGLGFGAGVYLTDQREGNRANTWQMPGYARVDTSISYTFKLGKSLLSAQLNVNNLLDKEYYADYRPDSFAIPGAPRSFLGSIRLDF